MKYKIEDIRVVVLAGGRDFRQRGSVERMPTALWSLAGKSVLERLLTHLACHGIKQATICSDSYSSELYKSLSGDNLPKLRFVDESLPLGSAGCVRAAVESETDGLILVINASIVCPPDIDILIDMHYSNKSDLTVMFNPARSNGSLMGEPAEIYVCNPSILENIPREGYFDIKEGLIPEMLRVGKTSCAAILPNHVGNFRDRREYLCAIGGYLGNVDRIDKQLRVLKKDDSGIVWVGPDTKINSNTRIYGPVAVMSASVSGSAVILGPAVLGRNVSVGRGSVVINSVIWDGAQIGDDCHIQGCVVGRDAVLRDHTVVEEKSISLKPKGALGRLFDCALKGIASNVSKLQQILQPQLAKVDEILPDWIKLHKPEIVFWLAGSLVLIAFLWSYWPGLVDIWGIWQRSDEYSSGLLVPFLVIYVLWSRRHKIAAVHIKPSMWGLFVFLASQALRLFGLFFMYGSAERLSVVVSIVALVLLLFGWQFLKKVSTILLFLCLMLPWPNRVQAAVTLPLQNWATSSAVFCLETIGYEVVQEGNIIHIDQATVAIAEACNGLRMVTAFFIISGLVVLLVERAWWEKMIVLISSLPIALLCNTVRLTITAMAFTMLHGEYWEKIFHDFGGYAMMPLALVAMVAELWLLAKLTTPPTKEKTIVITRQNK